MCAYLEACLVIGGLAAASHESLVSVHGRVLGLFHRRRATLHQALKHDQDVHFGAQEEGVRLGAQAIKGR